MESSDIHSAEDLEQFRQAEEWEKRIKKNGFYREHFFQAFSKQLNNIFDEPISILEIGSGPGHLAEHIFHSVKVESYTLFDLSKSMNHIALNRLKKYQSFIECKVGDILCTESFEGLGNFDAVICMQTIHEVRDKRLAVDIYKNVTKVLKPNGYFLVCDFVLGEQGMKEADIYMTELEQNQALIDGGFKSPTLALSYAGLTLYFAQKKS
ncbi:class I SAM-dependent methyltransferase [Spartinivicinus poritis]|uniref:Class I SAM-dependent methyltransferase n=1 Tax=Spartinivicinus poritis TaxID=2994640 RepID=A0ABT5UGM8_9GAMM|nr:class I SAM-dependent methyltransferase [Spartinivicinus sp. A2-2]MDE1465549.1 class I SAM-dependent methyltransferase [Spartinivicinus sp. A2-2]